MARWQALDAAGRLQREQVAFDDCPGERSREVETDPRGQVVRYVRHGHAGSVRFVAELYYAGDGALGAVRYREGEGAWRELRLPGGSAAAAGIPAAALVPARAGEVGAPARCRF